ncbi:MAG: BrnA antitoxin family protein [Candidatus Accumulibacter sp.]|jgi:uncharacterized protein (DUF4415 family)|nr:BrnA antitoxin family protein [Accumulibacter sp.]
MNENFTLPASECKDLDEAPVWTVEDFARATHQLGLKPVGKKQKISIALDPDVLAWFKAKAEGRGYQTLINAALREAMQGAEIAETLRRVIREERAAV